SFSVGGAPVSLLRTKALPLHRPGRHRQSQAIPAVPAIALPRPRPDRVVSHRRIKPLKAGCSTGLLLLRNAVGSDHESQSGRNMSHRKPPVVTATREQKWKLLAREI